MFDATGMSKPVGCSQSSAGPPPGDLHARSVTAAISRSGLTVSLMRPSSLRRSRSARKSSRSEYIRRGNSRLHITTMDTKATMLFVHKDQKALYGRPYFICDLLRHGEGAAAFFAGHRRRAALRDGIDEVCQFQLQRLLVDDVE